MMTATLYLSFGFSIVTSGCWLWRYRKTGKLVYLVMLVVGLISVGFNGATLYDRLHPKPFVRVGLVV